MPNATEHAVALQGYFLRAGSISAAGKVLQRKAAVQLRPGIDAFPVDLRPKSGGWPLPREVREKMENAMNASFSDVRIHVGPEAAAIGAIAFTWGSDIHFAPGQYNPHTPHGQFLLGHELTHVVQQRAGRVANPFGAGVAVVQDHALEAEADRLGRLAAQSSPPSAGSVQRYAAIQRYAIRPALRIGSGWEIQAAADGSPEAVGSVRLTPNGKSVYISDLTVDPAHRKHGVAKQLVQAAMQTARSHGFGVAQLEARPSPGAGISPSSLVAMYQKLGFRTTGHSHRGSPLMERRA
ncbi:MAG TPA: GNAT family N-acetyltransferase [Bryobacteraceae bacterium]|nr:GNAT family N-acetyltransferase [Bryobacteraceae bacterium]